MIKLNKINKKWQLLEEKVEVVLLLIWNMLKIKTK